MLILAATPIGNLEDASPRLRRVLEEADELYAEDTRQTRKLLQHFGINRRPSAYHEFSDEHAAARLKQQLESGRKVVYVTDAGMPGISDPGYELVQLAVEADVEVDVIPGPSAVINAVVLAGLPCHEFSFLGFFPAKQERRTALLQRLAQIRMTTVFFEAPSRITYTLEFLKQHLSDTQVALCRELTKLHQEVLRGTAGQVLEDLQAIKGEMVLVLAPVEAAVVAKPLEEQYEELLAAGNSPAQSVKLLAKEHRLSKRELYRKLNLRNSE